MPESTFDRIGRLVKCAFDRGMRSALNAPILWVSPARLQSFERVDYAHAHTPETNAPTHEYGEGRVSVLRSMGATDGQIRAMRERARYLGLHTPISYGEAFDREATRLEDLLNSPAPTNEELARMVEPTGLRLQPFDLEPVPSYRARVAHALESMGAFPSVGASRISGFAALTVTQCDITASVDERRGVL
jgi:hypothetical protein